MKLLSHVRHFATPWTVVHQALPSMGFSRQEYWSELPFPSPWDLPDPGIEPMSPESTAFVSGFLPLSHQLQIYSTELQSETLPYNPPSFPRSFYRCRPASWFENSPCLLFLPLYLSQEFSPNKPLACLIPSWPLLLRGPEVTDLPFWITCHSVLLSSPAFARAVPSNWKIFSFLLDPFLANSYLSFRIKLRDPLIRDINKWFTVAQALFHTLGIQLGRRGQAKSLRSSISLYNK